MTQPPDALLHAFKRFIHVLTTGKAKTFRCGEYTLYRAEVHILEIVGLRPGLTATDIARHMEVTKGAVSQIITKLKDKGLLRQEAETTNLKLRRLYVSEAGQEVLLAHKKAEEDVVRLVLNELRGCDDTNIATFTRVVNAVADFAKG